MGAYDKRQGFSGVRKAFESFMGWLEGAVSLSHDELEQEIDRRAREVARQAMQDRLDEDAAREERRDGVVGADGIERRRVEASSRALGTILGTVQVPRLAYRSPGLPNVHPRDILLKLPKEKHSMGVRQLAATTAACMSFADATSEIVERCGLTIGKRQVEQLVVRAARDIEAFYDQSRYEKSSSEELLVLSIDGKGVVMRHEDLRARARRDATEKKPRFEKRGSRGEPKGRKRTAVLSVVHDVAPHERTVDDVLGDEGKLRSNRPKPRNKAFRVHLEQGSAAAVAQLFDDAEQRDPERRRTWVVLVDGDNRLTRPIHEEIKARGLTNAFVLTDIVHVIEYLWKAAHAFFGIGNPKSEPFVEHYLRMLLEGRARSIPRSLSMKATKAALPASRRKLVQRTCKYIRGRFGTLDYQTALRRGLPIATGVIEGACRYLIADRMNITGARWSIEGAEAVIRLRALRACGHMDDYWAFHLEREQERNYPAAA